MHRCLEVRTIRKKAFLPNVLEFTTQGEVRSSKSVEVVILGVIVAFNDRPCRRSEP